jgi:hypothetical protein
MAESATPGAAVRAVSKIRKWRIYHQPNPVLGGLHHEYAWEKMAA